MFWSVGWPLLRAEGFFYNLDILHGGLGIGKLQFLIKKKIKKFRLYFFFFQFLVIKALDPDWIRIRIGLQPQTLDPDPEKMNTDPQPWTKSNLYFKVFLHITFWRCFYIIFPFKKNKKSKRSHKTVEIKVFLPFLLNERRETETGESFKRRLRGKSEWRYEQWSWQTDMILEHG